MLSQVFFKAWVEFFVLFQVLVNQLKKQYVMRKEKRCSREDFWKFEMENPLCMM